MTECNRKLRFSSSKKRAVEAVFDGGAMTSDGGVLLLREVERRYGILRRLAECIKDWREQGKVVHSLEDLLRERVFMIACGWEDCNDAATLRTDPCFKTACERGPEGEDLASQPSLSRLENRITSEDIQRLLCCLVDFWIEQRLNPSSGWIILDVDATDIETHGEQEFAFFHAYYDEHCYLPLLIHDGETGDLIVPFLRTGKAAAKTGADGILLYLAQRARQRWPWVKIFVRADSGFNGESFYRQLEEEGIFYLCGIARNACLQRLAEPLMEEVRQRAAVSETREREFTETMYRAESWSRERRIVIKAERLQGKDNPRFLVTNLPGDAPEDLYREVYCQRADASENRIKDLLNGCAGKRLSCHSFNANFFRLILHVVAYILLHRIRQHCDGTELERASITTIRLKLLKVGARVVGSVRRICFHLASSYPLQELWEGLHRKLVQVTC